VALQREIFEELGVEIRINEEFFTTEHDYVTKSVRLHFYVCTLLRGEPAPLAVADLRWIRPNEFCNFEFPPADADLIARLARDVRELDVRYPPGRTPIHDCERRADH